jgi:nucleoside-diphosphate-sugar epimerase
VRTKIFVTGGSGYIGVPLIERLIERGHAVTALARPGSERKLPPGSVAVSGDALRPATFAKAVSPDDTFVQLVGVPHPAPWKERQFRSVDLASARASVTAAVLAGVPHFVYVSVAHPAPTMRVYIGVRTECETMIGRAGLTATILRPWYVIGPGHRWPAALVPFYRLAERVPALRESALRLGLVTRGQMIEALIWAIENPPVESRVLDVPAIRSLSLRTAGSFAIAAQL